MADDLNFPPTKTELHVEPTRHEKGMIWWWHRELEALRAECQRCRPGVSCMSHTNPYIVLADVGEGSIFETGLPASSFGRGFNWGLCTCVDVVAKGPAFGRRREAVIGRPRLDRDGGGYVLSHQCEGCISARAGRELDGHVWDQMPEVHR